MDTSILATMMGILGASIPIEELYDRLESAIAAARAGDDSDLVMNVMLFMHKKQSEQDGGILNHLKNVGRATEAMKMMDKMSPTN